MAVRYHIGTSGWHYDDWKGRFYPDDLPKSRWLEFYAHHFHTVELNNSFYHLPSEKAFASWRDSAPSGFIFAVKASRYITHVKRLKDSQEPVEKFLERARNLNDKLGPVLYQLPPNFHRNDERLDLFLSGLPKGIQHVIEFRHESWLEDEVFDILRRHKVGICVFDMPDLTCPAVATADFAYVRFHGSGSLYSSDYSDEELADWAGKINKLARDLKEAYAYFNNDVEGFALNNARTLQKFLKEK
jgi:uncharacterized protein YecE (DUF72 family)